MTQEANLATPNDVLRWPDDKWSMFLPQYVTAIHYLGSRIRCFNYLYATEALVSIVDCDRCSSSYPYLNNREIKAFTT